MKKPPYVKCWQCNKIFNKDFKRGGFNYAVVSTPEGRVYTHHICAKDVIKEGPDRHIVENE